MKFVAIGAFFALASATAALAEIEINGWIKGTLGDEATQWDTIELPGEASTASWSQYVPGIYTVNVQGHLGGTFAIEKSLAITFELTENETVSSVNVVYLPTASLSEYYEGQIAPDSFTLTGVEFGEETMRIEGTVSGKLVHTKVESLDYIVDEGNTLQLNVEFMADARREQ